MVYVLAYYVKREFIKTFGRSYVIAFLLFESVRLGYHTNLLIENFAGKNYRTKNLLGNFQGYIVMYNLCVTQNKKVVVLQAMHTLQNLTHLLHTEISDLRRDFCGKQISDQKIARKVARLNSNVLHLCLTQNTKLEVSHPMHTLQNLMHLLNTGISDLGRIGPMEVNLFVRAQLHNRLVPDYSRYEM